MTQIRNAICAMLFSAAAFSQSADRPQRDRFEVRAFAGGMVGWGMFLSEPTVGVGGAVRLNKFVAFTGDYAYDYLGRLERLHEFTGGVRFSIPNGSRVTPYLGINAGGATFTRLERETRRALAVAGGANCRVTRRTGINFDARVLRFGPSWMGRITAGYYLRF